MLKCNYYPWIQSENDSLVILHRVEAAQLFRRQETIDIEGKVFMPMMRIKGVLLLVISMSVKIIFMGINILSPILTVLLGMLFPVSLHGKNNNFPKYLFLCDRILWYCVLWLHRFGKNQNRKTTTTTKRYTTTFSKYQQYMCEPYPSKDVQ